MMSLRLLLLRSPAVSALAAMIALVAMAWGLPVVAGPSTSVAQSRPAA